MALKDSAFYRPSVYRLYFKAALEHIRQIEADYAEECASYAEQGFRHHYCIHGINMWTDYDNICGGCENGDNAYESARGIARERWMRFIDRWDWAQAAPGDLDHDKRQELLSWAFECWPGK